jgi:hypothetical protein
MTDVLPPPPPDPEPDEPPAPAWAPPPEEARGRVARLARNPWLYLAVAAATILGPIATLVAPRLVSRAGNDDVRPPATSRPAVSADPATRAAAGVAGVGDCVDEARVVPCTSGHQYEVVAASGSCTATVAMAYLGGDPLRDVLLRAPSTLVVAGRSLCVVQTPGAATTFSPAKDALRGPASGRWRRCVDERFANEVLACSSRHTVELIGSGGPVAPDAAQCRTAAEAYMGVALDRVSDRLAVAAIPTTNVDDGSPRCLVRVLGHSLLTDTVRGIGVRALPVVAAE